MPFELMLCFALAAVFLLRNHMVYRARIAFIHADDFPVSYHALPEYDAMLLNPKYWLLWTKAHWRAWLARQQKASA